MKIACPVPRDSCSGGVYMADDVREKSVKCHGSHVEALACEAHYLLKTGHKQLGRREFLKPDGAIFILSRRPGGRTVPGKRGMDGTGSGKRVNAAGIWSW